MAEQDLDIHFDASKVIIWIKAALAASPGEPSSQQGDVENFLQFMCAIRDEPQRLAETVFGPFMDCVAENVRLKTEINFLRGWIRDECSESDETIDAVLSDYLEKQRKEAEKLRAEVEAWRN